MLKSYLKIAWKVLLRRKFYTFISLFGISFALLVLMVAASIFDHMFGPFPPEVKADRAVSTWMIQMNASNGNMSNGLAGYGFLDSYVRTLSGAERITLHSFYETVYSYQNGLSIELALKRTDGEFWRVYDFKFLEGGPFTAQDDKDGNFVAVINEATRRRFFGGEPAVGRQIEADGQHFRVVGVVANVPFFRFAPFGDIWAPIGTSKTDDYRKEFFGHYMGTVLAKSAADLPRIKEEYRSVLQRIEPPDKAYHTVTGGLDSLFEAVSRLLFSRSLEESRPGTLMAWLIGLGIVFLLLPTVNLVNINVSRIMERASEIGVRKAFGASSRTLVGQFVVENVVLTLVGGAIGFVLSLAALRLLAASDLMTYAEFRMNYRLFGYALATTLFFGVLSGVYPAWKMSRMHPVQALRGASR